MTTLRATTGYGGTGTIHASPVPPTPLTPSRYLAFCGARLTAVTAIEWTETGPNVCYRCIGQIRRSERLSAP